MRKLSSGGFEGLGCGSFTLGLAVVIAPPTSLCGGPFSAELLLGFFYCFYCGWGYTIPINGNFG